MKVTQLEIAKDREQLADQLAEVFGNVIFETPGPREINRKLTPEQQFFKAIWRGFIEIHNSFESLKDFEVFVSRFPFSKTRIGKRRYLSFVVESYLMEVYILKERLLAYLSQVGRFYRRTKYHEEILKKTKPQFRLVSDTLRPLTSFRSTHTHQVRFDTPDLDRLGTLETLSTIADDDTYKAEMKYLFLDAHRKAKKHWGKIIANNNAEIVKLLDIYFDILGEVLFDTNGQLKYPAI